MNRDDMPERLIGTAAQESIFHELVDVRNAQDCQWGGPAHDDRHNPFEWLGFIDKKLIKSLHADGDGNREEYRRRLVQVAALTIAAIESHDRKTSLMETVGAAMEETRR